MKQDSEEYICACCNRKAARVVELKFCYQCYESEIGGNPNDKRNS